MNLQNFYTSFRRVATHKDFVGENIVIPNTLAEYQANPSTKLDAAISILRYHIGNWGAPPLLNRQYEDQTPVDNKLYPQPVLPAHVLAEDVSSILDDDPDLPALEEIIAFDDELVDFEEDEHDEDQEPALPPPPPHSHEDQTMQDENQEPTPPPPPMKLPRAMRRQLAKARAKAAKHGKPDKIVMYVHFKSHFDYIEAVCFGQRRTEQY